MLQVRLIANLILVFNLFIVYQILGNMLKAKTNNVIGNEYTMKQNGLNEFAKDIENVNKLSSATTKLF